MQAIHEIHHLLQSQAANLNQMKSLSLSEYTLIQGIKRMKMNVNRTLTVIDNTVCTFTIQCAPFEPATSPSERERARKMTKMYCLLQNEKRDCGIRFFVQYFYSMDDINIDIFNTIDKKYIKKKHKHILNSSSSST